VELYLHPQYALMARGSVTERSTGDALFHITEFLVSETAAPDSFVPQSFKFIIS